MNFTTALTHGGIWLTEPHHAPYIFMFVAVQCQLEADYRASLLRPSLVEWL